VTDDRRVEVLEQRLARLEQEVAELRRGTKPAPEPAPERPPAPTMLDFVVPPATPVPAAAPVSPPPVVSHETAVPASPPAEGREPARQPAAQLSRPVPDRETLAQFLTPYMRRARTQAERLSEIDVSNLLGARVLAWAGGIVTVLGIVFFFVLAVNRGWIGPEIRVACGAAVSALAFGAGLWLRRRYGQVYSALTAAGAGLAGGYATLLAAAALYDLIPAPAALVFAAAIAGVGVVIALRWNAEPLAGLGLIGAMVVPAAVVLESGLTPLGTAFVAVVFAGAAYVAIERRWLVLLGLAIAAGLPQVAVLVAQHDARGSASVAAVATAFWLLYLATATWWHARLGGGELEPGPASLVVTTSVLGTGAAARIFDGTGEGVALLVVAVVEAALAGALAVRPRFRGLAAVAGIGALAVLAIAAAVLLGGPALTSAWAVEAAALAWAASRIRERRFQLASIGYLGLAVAHALAFEARPGDLLVATKHPGEGAVSAALLAGAAAVLALCARDWEDRVRSGGVLAPLDRLVDALGTVQREVRAAAGWAAGAFAVYAASLAILELGFDGAQAGVTALWAGLGLASVTAGRRYRRLHVATGGFVLLALALAKSVAYDLDRLSHDPRSLSLLAVGIACSLAAVVEQVLVARPWRLEPTTLGLLAAGVGTAAAGTGMLGGDAWLVAPAGGYAVLSALALARRDARDLASLLALPALVLAAIAGADVLDGTWLVVAAAAAGVALAAGASLLREPRLRIASLGYAVFALVHVLLFEARPSELFVDHDPSGGIPAVLLAGAALVVLGLELRRRYETRADDAERGLFYDQVVARLEVVARLGSTAALWSAGVLAVDAASLGLLSIAFDDVQPGVTALWAAVGLACVASLSWRRALRLGGLAFLLSALLKANLNDGRLSDTLFGLALAAVATAWALAGFAEQRLARRGLTGVAAALLVLGGAVSAGAALVLGGPGWLLAPAAGFALLWGAAFVRREERDSATLLAALALVLAGSGAVALLDGTWLVLAWTSAAAGLAGVSALTREPRFRLGSLAFLGLGVAHALAWEARPDRLFAAERHPGDGVPALALVVLAGVAVALELTRNAGYRSLPAAVAAQLSGWSKIGLWSSGVLAVYALSLTILELAQRVAPGTVDESFQRGQTGVSACWGLVGLALLYAGLRRRSTGLRLGGFALLGVSLAKIFLYDLANLSSITRALSFVTVGAVLLAGGLVYQRLAGESDELPGDGAEGGQGLVV
jgi:uncharacterized membrane protein